MTSKRTQAQALKYAKSLEGKGLDFDNFAGWQCFDVVNFYWNYLFNHGLKGAGAKDIPTWNNFTGEATVIKNVASTLAQPGDIFVYGAHWGGGWGHTGIVLSATLNSITVLEQNYLNGGMSKTEVTTKRTHKYDNPMWFIRPKYKAKTTVKEKAKEVVSKVKPTKKKKILIVSGHGNSDPGAVGNGTNERDFIRSKIAPNVVKYLKSAGHDADLYGGSKQNQNLFVDTQYGAGYGMYWVKAQKYDVVVELHLDAAGASASGGHVIISTAYPADKIDKNIDKMLRKTVGTIRGIDPRNNLLNANVSGQLNINYRLVEMGFITNKKDMDYLKKNYKAFSKDLAEAINDGAISGSVSSAPAKPTKPANKPAKIKAPKGYKVNKHGTYYKAEQGRFTNLSKPVQVRTVGPFLSCPKAYKFQPRGYCDYHTVMLQDGYVWIGYTWKGVEYYLPVREWSGHRPDSPSYSVGKAYGTFS